MHQIDIERALLALDGNAELLKDLASMFVEDAPMLIERLKIALSEKSPTKTRTAIHSLKGLVATFFAENGVEIAQRLEDAAAYGDLEFFFSGELDRFERYIDALTAECYALGWVDRI